MEGISGLFVILVFLVVIELVAIVWLVWRLAFMWRAAVTFRVGKKFPYVALACAMAASGDKESQRKFRRWLIRTVDQNGWQAAEEELRSRMEHLRRVLTDLEA